MSLLRAPGSLPYHDCIFVRSDPDSRPPAALVLQPALDHIGVFLPGSPLGNHSTEMWHGVLAVVSVEPAVVAQKRGTW